MARITVEDCLERVDNRFMLVMLAAKRTRQLLKGSRPLVDNTYNNNKDVVISLREIADGFVRPLKPLARQENEEPQVVS